MTDNIIKFPTKEPVKKTVKKTETDNVIPTLLGTTLTELVRELKVKRPDLYFDTHIIANDRQVLLNLTKAIQRIIELGLDPDPEPAGPIRDHKG